MRKLTFIALLIVLAVTPGAQAADELASGFRSPPASARPWVYWFWLNGNITKEGITADLEAMKRVGIGGVLIMEVDQGAPVGPVAFMGDKWREMFKHVVAEARRLGLEVNMNDDAGWNGSGGPWIKPAQSMQKVVFSETAVAGGKHFEGKLPQPQTVADYYRDIAVFAVPAGVKYRIPNIKVLACYGKGRPGPASDKKLEPEMVIDPDRIVDLTGRMKPDGKLEWDAPAGNWTILRMGHTSTGATNRPAPKTGRGLECDKLSTAGSEAAFNGMMAKLVDDVGGVTPGKGLVATHVDSWENGMQNWTAKMREEFRKRRGYDPLPLLVTFTGRVVGSLATSDRFLWDLRQTINELCVENYAGHLKKLAQDHGMRLTIEAYNGPCDDMTYAGRADEPMGEFWERGFWNGGGYMWSCKEMASAAHVYGKPIVGAESFTATNTERWLQHPGTIKALGDRAICDGINRFVFHRYAMQPWLNYRPGMTMGPWGLHYERTETWWDLTGPWHEYLARCHYLLRKGRFVADVCYLQPQASPQGFQEHPINGYDYDNCPAEVVMTRMSVKDGRIVLPDGMSYRLLVLPDWPEMTPELLAKIKQLVEAGAKVIGPRPVRSPSLTDYPKCDAEVKKLGEDLWKAGKIQTDTTPEKALASMGIGPDFAGPVGLDYIHRRDGQTEIYFVANTQPNAIRGVCTFRVAGKRPELWWPETGRIEPAAMFRVGNGKTSLYLSLDPGASVFVVFREAADEFDPVVAIDAPGGLKVSLGAAGSDESDKSPAVVPAKIVVDKARYGVLDDPKRTRDVRAKVQTLVDARQYSFPVSRLAKGDDPAFGTVKTAVINYTIAGRHYTARGTDLQTIHILPADGSPRAAWVSVDAHGRLLLEASLPGRYELTTATGRLCKAEVPELPKPLDVTGPWQVSFPAGGGAPAKAQFDKLVSWPDRMEGGIRYFSGTACYAKTIDVPRAMLQPGWRMILDLGKVAVMAQVKLNGKDLGILWKAPFHVDVTGAAKPGENSLEVRVTNLWINRMIGDENLPEDSDRNKNGTLKSWPKWVLEGKPSPTGRFTFTTWRLWKKGSPLQPSGLLGPVQLQATATVSLK